MEEKKLYSIMHDEEANEDDETLSLCDLSINDDSSKEDQGSSSSSSSDGFEFFTEEWSLASPPADTILFCGKLIPNKDFSDPKSPNKLEITNQHQIRVPSFKLTSQKFVDNIRKYDERNDVLDKKITILKSDPPKTRWFLFLSGSTRVTTEMEMREIRKRQIKRKRNLSFQSSGGKTIGGKGWWTLIRALGCNSHHHADAVIKASYGCPPRVRD